MRIAVSGTHFSGKSTLIAALLKEFSNYEGVEEPYVLLEQEGYLFSDPPTLEDFAEQCLRSIKAIQESGNNTIFDRCPLDCLAYALTLGRDMDLSDWIEKVEGGIQRLDLIVMVPLESPDRISPPRSENLKWRDRVDEMLHELILEDSLGILGEKCVLEVRGDVGKRVQRVKGKLS
ncbi:MAG: AAA family ATPase [Chlamydiia bacterium]|nr:AAA family ATPase [Chlamydiia bacterium]